MPRKNIRRAAQRTAATRHIQSEEKGQPRVTPLSAALKLRFIPNQIPIPQDAQARLDLADSCWACGNLGHKHRDCPNGADQLCWFCKEPGHRFRECPAPMDDRARSMREALAADYERYRRGRGE